MPLACTVVARTETTDPAIDVCGNRLQLWRARRVTGREITGLELQLRPLFDGAPS